MYRKGIDHLIWSNYHIDYDEWKKDFLENCAEEGDEPCSEREIQEVFSMTLEDELDEAREDLSIYASSPILVIGDLGLWNGRRTGYKEIENGFISNCLFSNTDYTSWYVDRDGEFCCDAIHHDGTNFYRYRAYRKGVSDEDIEDLKEMLYHGKATEADIDRVTQKLGKTIGKVYGWRFPAKKLAG